MMDENDHVIMEENFLDEDTEQFLKKIAKESMRVYFTQFCYKLTAWFTPDRINIIIDQFIENSRNGERQEEEEEEPQTTADLVFGFGSECGWDAEVPIRKSFSKAAGSIGSSGGVNPRPRTTVILHPSFISSQLEHQKRVKKNSTADTCVIPGKEMGLKDGDEMVGQVPVTQELYVMLETCVFFSGVPLRAPVKRQKKVDDLSVEVPVDPKPDIKPQARNVVSDILLRNEPVKNQKKQHRPAARASMAGRRPPQKQPTQRSPEPPQNPSQSTSVVGRNHLVTLTFPMIERVLQDPRASWSTFEPAGCSNPTQMVSTGWSNAEDEFDDMVRTNDKTDKEPIYFK